MTHSRKYKVCFIGSARYSKPLDTTSNKKFKLLSQLGEIFVIGFSENAHPRHFTEYAHFWLLPRWSKHIINYFTVLFWGTILGIWIVVQHGVDIIVAQSPYEGFVGILIKRLMAFMGKKVHLIVESHGDFEKSLFLQRKVLLPALYKIMMTKIARIALQEADVLRAVSEVTQEQLKKWVSGKPIIKFVAWTDIETFLAAGVSQKQRINNEKIVLYVGVLIPGKGIHFLLEAFARVVRYVPEARLLIVGKAENLKYAEKLKEQTRRLGLNGHVSFLEPVPQYQLAEYMARADVLVLPSLSEALGRVVFEAMACGTPVVGSNVGGIPEMIKEKKTGFLVPPGDVTALAERLVWMLQRPEEVKTMGENAHAFAKSFFSAGRYLQNYKKLFDLALRERNDATSLV